MTNEVEEGLKDGLYRVLDSNRLDVAKEIAADALGVELEEHLNRDLEEIDFVDDEFNGDMDYSLVEGDM